VAEPAPAPTAAGALRRLPWLLAIGAGMSPYLTKAVWEGLQAETGEFVRTPKKGQSARPGRYHARTILPLVEMALLVESVISVYTALTTGHYIAAPFALLYVMGFGYVTWSVITERMAAVAAAEGRRSLPATAAVAAEDATESIAA
jgi:hypothetical protein